MVEIEMCTIDTEYVHVDLDIYDINDTDEYDISLYLRGFNILLIVVDVSQSHCLDDIQQLYDKYNLHQLIEEEDNLIASSSQHQNKQRKSLKVMVGNKTFASKYNNDTILNYYAEVFDLMYIEFSSLISFPQSLISIIHNYYHITS